MYKFSDEHQMVRKMLRKWATEVLEPKVPDLEAGELPYDLIRKLGKTFGFADLVKSTFADLIAGKDPDPEADGSSKKRVGIAGPDPAMSTILAIELTRVCPGFMLAFGATVGLAGGAIMARGTPDQKRRWGIPILCLETIGAWGMTEPGAGSDAFRSMRTVAIPIDGGYRLSGQKTFITNAPAADTFVIYAKIDRGDGTPLSDRPIEAFICERGDKGLETSAPMKKMGMHSSPTGEIFLSDCEIPADRLLGGAERASGRAGGRDVFHSERTGMAPMCVGIIERCLEISVAYARERETWGKKIGEYQLVQQKLATMYMHLQNCENLMFKQMALSKTGAAMTPAEASATKLYCARAATECAMEAVQLLGGNGYMQEYKVEMLARDAKLLQIGGGTDEIQILHVARELLRS